MFDFGLVHAIALSSYQPICGGSLPCAIYNPDLNISGGSSPQYTWLANDLAAVSCTRALCRGCSPRFSKRADNPSRCSRAAPHKCFSMPDQQAVL